MRISQYYQRDNNIKSANFLYSTIFVAEISKDIEEALLRPIVQLINNEADLTISTINFLEGIVSNSLISSQIQKFNATTKTRQGYIKSTITIHTIFQTALNLVLKKANKSPIANNTNDTEHKILIKFVILLIHEKHQILDKIKRYAEKDRRIGGLIKRLSLSPFKANEECAVFYNTIVDRVHQLLVAFISLIIILFKTFTPTPPKASQLNYHGIFIKDQIAPPPPPTKFTQHNKI